MAFSGLRDPAPLTRTVRHKLMLALFDDEESNNAGGKLDAFVTFFGCDTVFFLSIAAFLVSQ